MHVMKAKVLNITDEYLLRNPLFSPEIQRQITGRSKILQKDGSIILIFTLRLVGLLVKSVDLSSLLHYSLCQW